VRELPSGTVTLLFTDIEGSTGLMRKLGDLWPEAHGRHRRILRESFGAAGGREVDTQGDSFFFVFPRVRDAARAAVDGQRGLKAADWPQGEEVRVRMAIHTGEPTVGEEGYLGLDVVRGARLCAAAHGGQIVLSETAGALLNDESPEGARLVDLGQHRLKDMTRSERVWQLALDDESAAFPPLSTDAPAAMHAVGRAQGLARQAEVVGRELAATIQAQVFEDLARTVPGSRRELPRASRRGRSRGTALIAAAVIAVLIVVALVWLVAAR
jgi:class 3 adenylate cyclase